MAVNRSGKLIIIAAPSGAGKTSIIKRFLETHPNMVHSISWTTRPARPGGVDEGYYKIVDKKVFEDGISKGFFAEWAEVHGHLYGTPLAPLEEALRDGKDILLDLDVKGSLRLKDIYKDQAVTIFVMPPSIDELKRRLSARATDSLAAQALRIRNALAEIEERDKFDYCVINDELEKVCFDIEKIVLEK